MDFPPPLTLSLAEHNGNFLRRRNAEVVILFALENRTRLVGRMRRGHQLRWIGGSRLLLRVPRHHLRWLTRRHWLLEELRDLSMPVLLERDTDFLCLTAL